MKITQVIPQFATVVWPVIKDFVDRSTEYSGERTESDDIKKDVESGKTLDRKSTRLNSSH